MKIKKKKAQVWHKCIIKSKLKFENYKSCLDASQLDNKIKYIEKHKIIKDILKKNHDQFIRSHKSIIKTQQIFKSERRNVFTEGINNTTHFFIMKVSNKRELQQIACNHSSDIDFINLYKSCITKSCSFLFIDATLASDKHLHFRKNLIERI